MIKVRNISKRYNSTPVVSDVSFSVEQGEVLVLLGTSGSGKTTTLKIINSLIEKDSGKVFIESEDTDDLTPFELRRRIGYVIQNIGLFPHYTIEQNIAVVPELLRWNKPEIKSRVDSLLEMMNLPLSMKPRKPHELSGGQQQRVGIARALAGDPSLILMDEPFGALDPITRQELQGEFKQLEGALNKAIILVTHDIVEAVSLGNRICLLNKGKVQQLGTPRELIFKPANDFVKEFFSQQRLQLELNVVTLRDLAPYINNSTYTAESKIDAETNLSDCLSQADGEKAFCFEMEGKVVTAEFDDILKLYFNNRDTIVSKLNDTGR